MKQIAFLFLLICFPKTSAQTTSSEINKNNNPVFKGWYADPEGIIFDKTYWVYPTFSARYEDQVFIDAFSSKDLVT